MQLRRIVLVRPEHQSLAHPTHTMHRAIIKKDVTAIDRVRSAHAVSGMRRTIDHGVRKGVRTGVIDAGLARESSPDRLNTHDTIGSNPSSALTPHALYAPRWCRISNIRASETSVTLLRNDQHLVHHMRNVMLNQRPPALCAPDNLQRQGHTQGRRSTPRTQAHSKRGARLGIQFDERSDTCRTASRGV